MIFSEIFWKKRQRYAAHAAQEENTGTFETGVFWTNEIGADNPQVFDCNFFFYS